MMSYFEKLQKILDFVHFDKKVSREVKNETARSNIIALISELKNRGYLIGAGMIASYYCPLFSCGWDDIEYFKKLASKLFEEESEITKDPLKLALTHIERSKLSNRLKLLGVPQNISLQAKSVYHREKAAEILTNGFLNDPHKEAYLVTGFYVDTNFADKLVPRFVDYEVEGGGLFCSKTEAKIPTPSAFQLFVSVSDYKNAFEVGTHAPDGFKYPGVCGWREVCQGFLEEKGADKHYLKAAEFFASDLPPEEGASRKKPYWSGRNLYALAPYFRARAALSKSYSNSEEVVEALKIAANEIEPYRSGFVHVPARKLAILVHGLGSFLKTNDFSVLDELSESYQEEINLWRQYDEGDKILLKGLTLVKQAIEGFQYNPTQEIRSDRLAQGIRILETIPEWSQSQFIVNFDGAFGEIALEVSQGTPYNDIAMILKRITDERILQRLLVELLREKAPYHAKVTHGPIEYGKDVIAIVEDEGETRLYMYAVKVGDIDSSKWRTAKEAIDQMFTVSINNPLVTQHQPSSKRGFLVFNGHFNQYIDPVANAWFNDELRSKRNWDVQVYDIDSLSRWIVSNRLVGVVRKFIKNING